MWHRRVYIPSYAAASPNLKGRSVYIPNGEPDNLQSMPKPSRLALAKRDILIALERVPQQVYSKSQLEAVLVQNRTSWNLAQRTSTDDFVDFLTNQGIVRSHAFVSERYGREIGLPCRKWSKDRVMNGPLLKGEFDAASEIYAGADHRQAA